MDQPWPLFVYFGSFQIQLYRIFFVNDIGSKIPYLPSHKEFNGIDVLVRSKSHGVLRLPHGRSGNPDLPGVALHPDVLPLRHLPLHGHLLVARDTVLGSPLTCAHAGQVSSASRIRSKGELSQCDQMAR